jgi:hypothetical protein
VEPYEGIAMFSGLHRFRTFRIASILLMLLAFSSMLAPALRVSYAQDTKDERKFNVVILVDESGSMWVDTDKEERDPNKASDPNTGLPVYLTPAARITAVESLLTSMSGELGDATFNVGIVTFGTDVKVAFPMQPLAGNLDPAVRGLVKAHTEYEPEPTVQYTNSRDAIRSAQDMLFDANGNSRSPGTNIVLMISDGVPESRETLEAQGERQVQLREALRNEVRDNVASLTNAQGQFISIIVNTSGSSYARANYDFWSSIATQVASNPQSSTGGSCGFWKVEDTSLLFRYTRGVLECILRRATAIPPEIPLPPGVKSLQAVEDYTREFVLTIRKNDPNTKIDLRRPNGNTINKQTNNDSGDEVTYSGFYHTESYRIKHPAGSKSSWAGCWTVEIAPDSTGRADANVSFVVIARGDYSLAFEKPLTQVWPVGKPMPVSVGVYSEPNQSVDPNSIQLNQTMGLNVETPNGEVHSENLVGVGTNYEGRYTRNELEGSYVLTSTISSAQLHKPSPAVEAGGCKNTGADLQANQISGQTTISMKLIPWVDLVQPRPDSTTTSDKLQVRAKLMLGTNPYTPAAGSADQIELAAGLTSAASPKRKAASMELLPDRATPGEYTSRVGAVGDLPAGVYTMTVRLDSILNGENSSDVAQIRLTLGQAPTRTPVPPTATPVLPTETAVPEPTIVVTVAPTPVPTPPCASPDCSSPPSFPWFLVLGALAVGALGAGGLLAYRSLTGGARMDGVRVSSFTGSEVVNLKGKSMPHDLGGARVKFTAAPGTGQPSIQVISSSEPVSINGLPQEPGTAGAAIPLNQGDEIQVGNETYTVAGEPRMARGSKRGSLGPVDPYDPGISDV